MISLLSCCGTPYFAPCPGASATQNFACVQRDGQPPQFLSRARCVRWTGSAEKLGWTSTNPAGMHLLVPGSRPSYPRDRRTPALLDLALLSAYRAGTARGDGLFLRSGGLDAASLQAGTAALVAE